MSGPAVAVPTLHPYIDIMTIKAEAPPGDSEKCRSQPIARVRNGFWHHSRGKWAVWGAATGDCGHADLRSAYRRGRRPAPNFARMLGAGLRPRPPVRPKVSNAVDNASRWLRAFWANRLDCQNPLVRPIVRYVGAGSAATFVRVATSNRGTIWAGEHDGVAVRVAQPAFPVIWPTVTFRRIAMARHDDFGLHLGSAGNG